MLLKIYTDRLIPRRVCCRWWWSQCWCASLVVLRATWRGCVCAWSPPSSCTQTHTQRTGEVRSEAHVPGCLRSHWRCKRQGKTPSRVQFYPQVFHTIRINEEMHATGTLMRLEVTPHSSRAHKHTAVSGPLTASRRHQHSRAHQSGGGDVTAQRLPVKCI